VHVKADHTLVYRRKLEQYFSAPGPGASLLTDRPVSEVVWVADLTELTRGLVSRVVLLDEACLLDYSCPGPADLLNLIRSSFVKQRGPLQRASRLWMFPQEVEYVGRHC